MNTLKTIDTLKDMKSPLIRSFSRQLQIRVHDRSFCRIMASNLTDKTKENRVLLVVAAALIDKTNRKVLLAQRPSGSMKGLWEFPGGKIEANETPEVALERELKEELGISIDVRSLAPLTFASHNYKEQGFHLLMPIYTCLEWEGTVSGKENQQIKWVSSVDLSSYPMPPADLPILPPLIQFLHALP